MIEAVIFDFDGVIADTEHLHYASYQKVLEPKGFGFSYDEYAARYMAYDSFGCLKQRMIDLDQPVEGEEIRRWVEQKNAEHERLIAQGDVSALPGAVDAILYAASRGPVAVCTGAVLSDIAPLLEKFALMGHLSTVVTADDVSVSKPDPESYALACSRLNQNPEDCLAIEDTPGGLQSAKGAGCQTLGVTTTHTREQLRPIADRVISSLVDFRL
jgi:beta-phosphoglucomutase